MIKTIICFITSCLAWNSLYAAPETSADIFKCRTLQLTIHNETKRQFNISFPTSSKTNIQLGTLLKPRQTTTIQSIVYKADMIGNLIFFVQLGWGKSFYVVDPFTTYPGVFEVQPGKHSQDLQFIINNRVFNPGGKTCLFVHAADVSIRESM